MLVTGTVASAAAPALPPAAVPDGDPTVATWPEGDAHPALATLAERLVDAPGWTVLGSADPADAGTAAAAANLVQHLVRHGEVRLVVLDAPTTIGDLLAADAGSDLPSATDARLVRDVTPFAPEPLLDLARWLRSWNEAHPDDVVRLVGIGAKITRNDHRALREIFEVDGTLHPDAAGPIALIERLLPRDDAPERTRAERPVTPRTELTDAERDDLLAALAALATLQLELHRSGTVVTRSRADAVVPSLLRLWIDEVDRARARLSAETIDDAERIALRRGLHDARTSIATARWLAEVMPTAATGVRGVVWTTAYDALPEGTRAWSSSPTGPPPNRATLAARLPLVDPQRVLLLRRAGADDGPDDDARIRLASMTRRTPAQARVVVPPDHARRAAPRDSTFGYASLPTADGHRTFDLRLDAFDAIVALPAGGSPASSERD